MVCEFEMSTNIHNGGDRLVVVGIEISEDEDLHRDFEKLYLVDMASEKRKAPDEWIKVSLLSEEGSRGVYLGSFSGVLPPESTTFRVFKRKRTDDAAAKDVILQGETERIEFEGRTVGNDDIDTCQYFPFS